jgi:ABC-2 type transport system ATP-binding protein
MEKDITIKTDKLEKVDNKKMLMTDISINLHRGEIFALVGETGSGKTLFSKLLVNVSWKTGGHIRMRSGEFIGIALDRQKFLPTESVITTIKDYCKINGRIFNAKRAKNILQLVNLRDKLHTQIANLTDMEAARLKIALPIITCADIIILDDPSVKLNEEENRELGALLKTLADKRKTAVLITARKLDKIEEYCDTIGIIDDGMIVSIKSYNEMIADDEEHAKISIRTLQPNYAAQTIEHEMGFDTKLCGENVIVNTFPDNAERILDGLRARGIEVITAVRVSRTLQEIYYDMVRTKRNYQ